MPIHHMIRRAIAVIGASALIAAGASVTVAQDATPPIVVESEHTYPVSIHQGTCEAPVAQPVGSTADTSIAGLEEDSEFVGVTGQPPVTTASVGFDGTLEDLTSQPHVVAVHASPEQFGVIVACGEIAGYVHDGSLVIPIGSMPGEEVSGIAVVHHDQSLLDRALEELGSTVELSDRHVTVTAYIVPADGQATGD